MQVISRQQYRAFRLISNADVGVDEDGGNSTTKWVRSSENGARVSWLVIGPTTFEHLSLGDFEKKYVEVK